MLRPSPPVPQVSTTTDERASIRVAFCRMIRAAPVTSSTVSPFIRSAVMKAAIWAGVASPSMISVMTAPSSPLPAGLPCDDLRHGFPDHASFSFPVPGDQSSENCG